MGKALGVQLRIIGALKPGPGSQVIKGPEAVFSVHLLEAGHCDRRGVRDDEDMVIPKSLGHCRVPGSLHLSQRPTSLACRDMAPVLSPPRPDSFHKAALLGCSLTAASWNCRMKEPIGAWSPVAGLGGVQQHPTSNPREVEEQPPGLGGTRFLRSSHSLIAAKRVPAARRHDMKVPTLPG